MFKFNEYVVACREANQQTQSELVEALIDFDSVFKGVDTTTLSRWERGVSKPSITRQTAIVKYFSEVFNRIFPFLSAADSQRISDSFCANSFSKLIGRYRMVMDFPSDDLDVNSFKLKPLNESARKETALNKNYFMIKEMYGTSFSEILHRSLVEHPVNHCVVCECQGEYFGHLVMLKLKHASFKTLMDLEMKVDQIRESDLVFGDEKGSYFVFGLLGLGNIVGSLLWVNFYSHLIKMQDSIECLGAAVVSKDGEAIARNLNTELVKRELHGDKDVRTYQAPLAQLLLTDNVIKMLFNPDC